MSRMHLVLLVIVAIFAFLVVANQRETYAQDALVSAYDSYQRGIGLLWSMYATGYAKKLSPTKQRQFKALQTKLEPDIKSTAANVRATLMGLSDADKRLVLNFFQTLNTTMKKRGATLSTDEKQILYDIASDLVTSMKS